MGLFYFYFIEKIIPITAENAMNIIGCSFFVNFTLFVNAQSTIARTIPCQFILFTLNVFMLSNEKRLVAITLSPAAATRAVEAGRKP